MDSDKKLFSMTASDFEWSYTRGTGSGGQKKNKTSSAVHCMHPKSGAHGYAEDSRSQHDNKSLAFKRLTETKEFQEWLRKETMVRSGKMAQIDAEVAKEMRKIKVEIKKDGKWTEVNKDDPLLESEDDTA